MRTMSDTLTPDLAERFARIALGHVEREYPNKPDHVLDGPADAQTPAGRTPTWVSRFWRPATSSRLTSTSSST